jgi:hypothetical protein
MKTIGFIKEHDSGTIKEEYLDKPSDFDFSFITEREKKKITNYLNNAETIWAFLRALSDGDNYIGPYTFLSDGEWIWPSHFAYYLNKFDFSSMTDDFLNHIRAKEYKVSPLTLDQKRLVELFLGLKVCNLGEKVRESLRRNAIRLGYDISEY